MISDIRIVYFLTAFHWISVQANFTKPSSLTLGFIGPTNLPNANSQTGGHPALFAFKLAIRDVNANKNLLPNTNLTFVWNNTDSDIGNGSVAGFWQCEIGKVIGIVGEHNSVVSEAVQYASRHYRVPQISYGSTSSEFTSHKSKYPYFLRTTTNHKTQAAMLGHLIYSQGWTRVAVLYTTDSQTFHSTHEFFKVASKLGISIIVTATFATGAKNIMEQMDIIKKSQARIILFVGVISDQQTVIENSIDAGIHGRGYQWIGIQAAMYTALYRDEFNNINQKYFNWVQGFLGVHTLPDTESIVYKEYEQRWKSAPYDPDTSTVRSDEILPLANFAYDAVLMFAHALHHMIEDLELNPLDQDNRELFLKVLKRVNFTGVSGTVNVDDNGDRAIPFSIINFQATRIVRVGDIDLRGNVTYLPNEHIIYMGGTTTRPLDSPIRPLVKISTSIVFTLLSISVAITLLCFILMIIVLCYRNHPVIRASSFPFLIIMLIGIVCIAMSIIPRTLENVCPSTAICIGEFFLVNFGYSLIMTTLMLKTYRLSTIFHMRYRMVCIHLRDRYLLMILTAIIILSNSMTIGLLLDDPFYFKRVKYDAFQDFQYCTSEKQSYLHVPVVQSTRFTILTMMSIAAYRIRKIPDLYNETRQLVFTIYNLTFLSIALPTLDLTVGRGRDIPLLIYAITTFAICFITMIIMFLPKLIMMATMNGNGRSQSLTFKFSLHQKKPSTKKNFNSQTSFICYTLQPHTSKNHVITQSVSTQYSSLSPSASIDADSDKF